MSVELSVPDDAPRVVPHEFVFPVSARFTSPRGVPCAVRLHVTDGHLSAIAADASEDGEGLLADWDPNDDPLADVRLPALESVAFVTETTDRP